MSTTLHATDTLQERASKIESILRELSNNSKIFSVDFIKRSTGEERHMVCRFNVRKHLTGGGRAYEPNEKGLICVFDVQKEGYRTFPIGEGELLKITVGGEVYEF